ncbi:IclR family transcriptional regulator [Pseudorhodoplanes sp.]|uniref:IclR family transcriptional regulator n=1 Tax=Pseudorhodoplanes sp. TaxID=1934341 RepID=UPI003D10911D
MSDLDDRRDYGVRSVQLALDILEIIAMSGEELGVTQIADQLRLTKGSVYRHLQTLVERGYLTQNLQTTRYHIGPRSRMLARLSVQPDLIHAAEPLLWDLRNTVGQTVVLSEMGARGAVVVKTVPGPSPIEIGVRPGSELAFHASAQGKILLANAPESLQKLVLAGPLRRFTDHTITKRSALEAELQLARKRGDVSAPEESILGLNAIAAPIFGEDGSCVAAIAIVGSIQFIQLETNQRTSQKLTEAARQVSNALGHRPAKDSVDAPAQAATIKQKIKRRARRPYQ